MKNIKYKILSNSCQVVYGNNELDVLSCCVKIVGSIFVLLVQGVPKKTIHCLISCNIKSIKAISLK